jgi:ATP synthase protein I
MADDQQPTNKDERSGKESFVVTLARYSQLAFTLPAATMVGWLIGYGLDHWLHTTFLYLVGLLLGIVAGFVELVKTVSKES